MAGYKDWQSVGFCSSVNTAKKSINENRPALLFLDWSLTGGNAFEVLQYIQNIPDYNPYIIFNTGYQNEHPEIPQEIINNYSVDKYLIKPFWETLKKNLPDYLREAEDKSLMKRKKLFKTWIKNVEGKNIPVSVDSLSAVIQYHDNPRKRVFFFVTNTKGIIVSKTWEECYAFLDKFKVDYFITKKRQHLIVRDHIEYFSCPYIKAKGCPFKFEVV